MDTVKIDSRFADKNGEIMVVELEGYIDQSNYHRLQKIFDDVIKSGCHKVIVDMDKLEYMSSAGWGVFIGEVKRFRDDSGDIKLVNMHDDVYDVFHLLEFYHILEDYSSVNEAAAMFSPHGVSVDLTVDERMKEESPVQSESVDIEVLDVEFPIKEADENKISEGVILSERLGRDVAENIMEPARSEPMPRKVKLDRLPLREKVKKIIAQNPLLTIRGIKKVLRNEQFGNVRIGFFRLRKLLKDMDLDSKQKRYRYYRSC